MWQLVITVSERIQILCATMHQTDFAKLNEMNINDCDVIFANQTERFQYEECCENGYTAKMFSTATIGVGKNRNYALSLATGDILLLADDDLRYEDDVCAVVREAFSKQPDADVMLFGLQYEKDGKIIRTKVPPGGRVSVLRSLRYGTCAIAVKRKTVLSHNLHFSELFGGGCLYSYGEDTDFIVQCFRAGMKVFSSTRIIATTKKDQSTCYNGYGAKFFFDKGALARHSLGVLAFPYMMRMALKEVDSELKLPEKLKFLWNGYRSFPRLISFECWMAQQNEENHHCK